MALQKQPVQVLFGAANQKRQSKSIAVGKPTVALNVVQDKTGSYVKRGGFVVTDRNVDTGTLTTGRDLVLDGTVPVIRTADTIFARPPTGPAAWVNRGSYLPVSPSQQAVSSVGAGHPLMVEIGTQRWFFSQATDPFLGDYYYYSVVQDGVEIVPPTKMLFGIPQWARLVTTAGKVWLFFKLGAADKNIYTYMFTAATPAVNPTLTTYGAPTGVSVDLMDVLDAGVNGQGIIVAVGSKDAAGIAFGGASRALFFSRLNVATGLPDGTGWVGDATVALGALSAPFSWVRAGQSAATFHFLTRKVSNNHAHITSVTAATLVSATVDMGNPGASLLTTGGLVGYREAGGNVITFVVSGLPVENASIVRSSWNGAALTNDATAFAFGLITLSDPFFIGTVPYIALAHDDGNYLQNAYYIAAAGASPGRFVSRALYGLGGNAWQTGERVYVADWNTGWHVPVTVSGNVASMFVGKWNGGTFDCIRLAWDFAPADLGSEISAVDGQQVVLPGGWPSTVINGSMISDLTPSMFPRTAGTVSNLVTAGATLLPGIYQATICYAVTDRAGNIKRSAPAPVQTVTVAAGEAIAFTNIVGLRPTNTSVQTWLELYITDPNGELPALSRRIPNQLLPVTLLVMAPNVADAEILYTSGGALEHISAPPCKWAAAWRNRIFLGGTDTVEAEVWPSFELTPGFAPAWQESLRFRVPDGAGKDIAGCAVDFNYFAIFKRDSTWVISGVGPDPIGVGSYANTLQQISDAPGCVNPRSVVSTPIGAMYQSPSGQIWLISRQGGAQYMGEGWADHEGATVVAAVNCPDQELVLFFTSSGVALVFDYGNPLPEQGSPLGQQYVWTLPAVPVAAAVSGSTIYYLDGTGVMRTYAPSTFSDDGTTAILRKLKLPLTLGGIRGYQRLYRGQIVGQYVDSHSLKVTVDNFAGVAGEAAALTQNWTRVVSAGPELVEFRPDHQRCTALDLMIEDVGTDLHAAASWDGVGLEIGVKGGLPRLATTQRM